MSQLCVSAHSGFPSYSFTNVPRTPSLHPLDTFPSLSILSLQPLLPSLSFHFSLLYPSSLLSPTLTTYTFSTSAPPTFSHSLTGLSPFAGNQKTMTMANISLVKLSLPQQYFADVSQEAKNFIKQLLVQQER